MRNIRIVNSKGYEVSVAVEWVDGHTEKVVQDGEHVHCLTCGCYPKNAETLHVMEIGIIEGLRAWLKDRQHFVEDGQRVLMCGNCEEDFQSGD